MLLGNQGIKPLYELLLLALNKAESGKECFYSARLHKSCKAIQVFPLSLWRDETGPIFSANSVPSHFLVFTIFESNVTCEHFIALETFYANILNFSNKWELDWGHSYNQAYEIVYQH